MILITFFSTYSYLWSTLYQGGSGLHLNYTHLFSLNAQGCLFSPLLTLILQKPKRGRGGPRQALLHLPAVSRALCSGQDNLANELVKGPW